MRPPLAAGLLLLAACTGTVHPPERGVDTAVGGGGELGGSAAPPGWIEVVGGPRCVIDDTELLGFCGEGATVFWAGGDTELATADCDQQLSAVVWMANDSWAEETTHSLAGEPEVLDAGQAAVWFEVDGEVWVGDSGSAQATDMGGGTVRVVFDAPSTIDFVSRAEAGPAVRGEVWCTLPDAR